MFLPMTLIVLKSFVRKFVYSLCDNDVGFAEVVAIFHSSYWPGKGLQAPPWAGRSGRTSLMKGVAVAVRNQAEIARITGEITRNRTNQ